MSESVKVSAENPNQLSMARRWPAYWTASGSAAFGLLHWYWGAGGQWLYIESTLPGNIPHAVNRDLSYILPMLWGVGAVCLLGSAVALATLRQWNRALTRKLLLASCWIACALIGFRALGNLAQHFVISIGWMHPDPAWNTFIRMDLYFFSPWFTIWALFWAFTSIHYRRATKKSREDTTGPDGDSGNRVH
jgi:hypothetical protein